MLNTKLYLSGYTSDLLRGTDEPRPWDLTKVILTKTNTQTRLLDIGCGDARKLIPLASQMCHISAMEPSNVMRSLAANKINTAKINNISLIAGRAKQLPFNDHSFDVVTCILSTWDSQEIYRVLKPGGWFINETFGCEDKLEFKKAFGKDREGNWRGQLISVNNNTCMHRYKRDLLQQHFGEIAITNGFWNTYYTQQGLLELCEFTPTISGFDRDKDRDHFNDATQKLMTEKGIKIKQNRLLIIAKKPQSVFHD